MHYLPGRSNAFRGATEEFPLSGLVALWKCEESSGDLVDSVSAIHLTPTGTPNRRVTGKVGFCVFGPRMSSSSFVYSNPTWFPAEAFTLNAWVLWTAYYSYTSFRWFYLANGSYISGYASDSSNYLAWNGTVTMARATAAVAVETWYMATITRTSGGQHGLYLNGESLTLSTSSDSTTDWSAATQFKLFDLGGVGNGGAINQPAIWNRVLTPTEVSVLYNGGQGLVYPE